MTQSVPLISTIASGLGLALVAAALSIAYAATTLFGWPVA